jgi:hypothetical protein
MSGARSSCGGVGNVSRIPGSLLRSGAPENQRDAYERKDLPNSQLVFWLVCLQLGVGAGQRNLMRVGGVVMDRLDRSARVPLDPRCNLPDRKRRLRQQDLALRLKYPRSRELPFLVDTSVRVVAELAARLRLCSPITTGVAVAPLDIANDHLRLHGWPLGGFHVLLIGARSAHSQKYQRTQQGQGSYENHQAVALRPGWVDRQRNHGASMDPAPPKSGHYDPLGGQTTNEPNATNRDDPRASRGVCVPVFARDANAAHDTQWRRSHDSLGKL